MQNFLFVFYKEDGHHLVTQREALFPVLIVKICLDILLFTVLVLFDDEFFEWVLKDTAEDPFLQDLEVGVRSLLKEESKEVPDGSI